MDSSEQTTADAADRAAGRARATAGRETATGWATAAEPDSAKVIADLRFELGRNAAYHGDRLAFFTAAHRWIMFVSALGGTAAIGTALSPYPGIAVIGGIAVAVATTLDLVYDLRAASRLHERLREDSFELLACLEAAADEGEISRCRATMMRSFAREPQMMRAVDALAWNASFAARTKHLDPNDLLTVPFWHRLMRHLRAYSGIVYTSPKERQR
jgi:hypothetical protein